MTRATLCLVLLTACISAPPLVIADRKTALEEQAAGSFAPQAAELEQAGVSARPVPYTRGQLESAGVPVGKAADALAPEEARDDADLLDQLLTRRCIGEALDGTLAETPATCTQPVPAAQQSRLVERENRRRFQIWRSLASGGRSLDEVRKVWREAHLGEVIRGGQVQIAAGWEAKRC